MGVVLDFTNVQGGSFTPVPEGEYNVVLEKAEMKKAKTDGSDMISVTWSITDEEYENRKLFENYSLKPQALWKLKNTLGALGFDVSGALEFDVEDLVGQEAVALVVIETYEGKEKNTVKEIK